MVRHPDTHGFFIDIKDLRNTAAGLEDERKRARQRFLQDLKNGGINSAGILAYLAQIAADKRQIEFLRLDAQHITQVFNGLFIHQITTDPVDRVGWIYDESTR